MTIRESRHNYLVDWLANTMLGLTSQPCDITEFELQCCDDPMSEESLKDYVLEGMKPYWRKGVKHADAFTPGVSDVSGYVHPIGTVWIELKALHDWPKRVNTVVTFGYDDLQKDFTWERRGWLFVRVKREYLLFNRVSAQHIDTPAATQQMVRDAATRTWKNSVDWKEFTRWLKKRQ